MLHLGRGRSLLRVLLCISACRGALGIGDCEVASGSGSRPRLFADAKIGAKSLGQARTPQCRDRIADRSEDRIVDRIEDRRVDRTVCCLGVKQPTIWFTIWSSILSFIRPSVWFTIRSSFRSTIWHTVRSVNQSSIRHTVRRYSVHNLVLARKSVPQLVSRDAASDGRSDMPGRPSQPGRRPGRPGQLGRPCLSGRPDRPVRLRPCSEP